MAGDDRFRGVDRHDTYRGFPTPPASASPSAPETTRKAATGSQTKHERIPMFRTLMIGAVSALTLSTAAFAQQGPQEARAMLDKAIAAVKADPVVAIAMFIKGEGGFRDRDLYPFCFRIADGKTLSSPKAVPAGTVGRRLKDATGNSYGHPSDHDAQFG